MLFGLLMRCISPVRDMVDIDNGVGSVDAAESVVVVVVVVRD